LILGPDLRGPSRQSGVVSPGQVSRITPVIEARGGQFLGYGSGTRSPGSSAGRRRRSCQPPRLGSEGALGERLGRRCHARRDFRKKIAELDRENDRREKEKPPQADKGGARLPLRYLERHDAAVAWLAEDLKNVDLHVVFPKRMTSREEERVEARNDESTYSTGSFGMIGWARRRPWRRRRRCAATGLRERGRLSLSEKVRTVRRCEARTGGVS
jgi:hypothetical protein